MDESSTTAQEQPVAASADAPVTDSTATDTTQTQPAGQPEPSKPAESAPAEKPEGAPAPLDTDLDDWITKRGFPQAADEAQKQAYQDMRNEQREFTRGRQSKDNAAELNRTLKEQKPETSTEEEDSTDPLEKTVRTLEEKLNESEDMRQRSEFYVSNQITTEEHTAIQDLFKEKIDREQSVEAKQKAFEIWSKPGALSDLLDLAKARIANTAGTKEVTERAAQEERERIAQESKASSPSRSATNVSPTTASASEERTQSLLNRYSTNK